MTDVDWICQGCGKAHLNYVHNMGKDINSCNRCGWKRKAEKKKKKSDIITDQWFKYSVAVQPMESETAYREPKNNCCCPCPSTYLM